MDITNLNKYWWAIALRGFFAILLGLAALFWPAVTLGALVIVIGAYFLADGLFATIGAFQAAAHHGKWWMLLLEGIIGLAAGGMTFLWPGNTALILIFIIAAWAILTGIFELGAAFTAPWSASRKWMLGISGLLSIIFGFLVYLYPGAGILAMLWILGAYALVFGVMLISLGLGLRKN